MITPELPTSVQMQFLRPGQLEKAAREFPVVYVPFGLIEWHGLHLPLGNDALKAHAILVKAAEKHGGLVYPPVYFHWEFKNVVPVFTELFKRLKAMGFRVIIGVSGHNMNEQTSMINEALEFVKKEGGLVGEGLWEVTLSKGPDSDTDHAGKWETANMMFFYPELVDLKALGDGPLAPGMQPPDGIMGKDPRVHATAEVGRLNCELAAESIGKRAHELLASLPPEQRNFNIPEFKPPHWWWV